MRVEYYIIHPNGREKIKPTPVSDTEAIEIFKNHWSSKANWIGGKKRSLIKETKDEIYTMPL